MDNSVISIYVPTSEKQKLLSVLQLSHLTIPNFFKACYRPILEVPMRLDKILLIIKNLAKMNDKSFHECFVFILSYEVDI